MSYPVAQGDGKTAEACPFCGSRPRVCGYSSGTYGTHPLFVCPNTLSCPAGGGAVPLYKWNKRVSPGTAANKEADEFVSREKERLSEAGYTTRQMESLRIVDTVVRRALQARGLTEDQNSITAVREWEANALFKTL